MGVCIDVYRARIGTFSSSSCGCCSTSTTSTTISAPHSSFSWTRRIAILAVFAISIVTLFAVGVHQVDHADSSTRPPTCPPGPAWDTTAWSACRSSDQVQITLQQLNHELHSSEFPYRTRLATGLGIRREDHYKHDVTKTSFAPRTTATWNLLPANIRSLQSVDQFKQHLRPWIRQNIQVG